MLCISITFVGFPCWFSGCWVSGSMVSVCYGVLQGPSNPLSLRRTFGTTGEPKLKLYRDHAAWCPYCQKVRPALCPQQHIAGKEATACC